MKELLTPSNILALLGIMGVIFGVFLYFKNPQVNSDKVDALLNQQIRNDKDDVERRFKEMQVNLATAMTMAQNHIHTIDTKVDNLSVIVTSLGRELVKLQTIIDERMPRR